MGLSKLFMELDCSCWRSILFITSEGDVHCLDAKVNIDGNALYRQKRISEMNDPHKRMRVAQARSTT